MRPRSKHIAVGAAFLALVVCSFGFAQNGASSDNAYRSGGPSDNSYSNRTRAIAERDSRAEREAERIVSLPAEKIIVLLEREPGLFLQVKKMLVRKAYQEGRVLDPRDLTDDAMFRLIRKDETIRALITNEIEDRNYVRVKPSREEMERQWQRRSLNSKINTEATSSEQFGGSQEEEYWSSQQRQLRQGHPQNGVPQNGVPPSSNPPENPPTAPGAPTDDARRRQLQAQAQGYEDSTDGLPLDVIGGGQQINPDQLAQLLSARNSASASTNTDPRNGGDLSNISLTDVGGTGARAGSNAGTSNGPVPNFSASDDVQPVEQARMEMLPRPTVPPLRSATRADQPALGHRPNPYADVPSLYDLYSQYTRRSPTPTRFGADVFENGTGNSDQLPMDLPVGPDYVLGPGDGVNIDLWGSFSQRLRRAVDHEGRLALPEVGSIQVSGRSLGDVQHLVQTALRSQFRHIEADVSLSRLRTVRVYVVGDVRRPGAYDVSSLSTALNALYQAGGPTSRGSLRTLKHFRGKQLIESVDIYDLLLHGIHSGTARLQSGDTLLVPPIASEVTVQGMVRRPAVYELNGEQNLAEVLELAGGVLPSGTLRHVDVERVQAHESRSMLRLDIPENNNEPSVAKALEDFKIQDGDQIKISPILPFADKTVYLDGHVFRPGKYAYRDGMKVTDLIQSYKDVMPEPYKQHAEIIRLKAPDFTPQVLAFNLEDALSGKDQDLVLKPFDTVRVFGRFDFEDPPTITVTGEVRDPGDHVTNGATYLRDAVFLAGSTTPDAQLDDVQVFRRTDDGKLKVLSVNLSKALTGDARENVLLQPTDRVFIHKNLSQVDPPTVEIEGEVARPGKYPLGTDMSAADLVRLSGGLKRSAYTEEADLTRYWAEHGSGLGGEHVNVPLAQAMAGEPDTDVRLHDGDVLTVRQLPGWNDIGATIDIKGEVVHPGTYGIEVGERLSTVLARAGGLLSDAYPYGAVLERAQIRELQEKSRAELIREVQQEGAALKAQIDEPAAKEASLLQWRDTLEKLQSTPPVGRLVIHVSSNVKQWANTPADVQVRAGDVLYIPKRPNFVMVDGAVYNQTAITFKPNRSASWYLRQAGGPTTMADKKGIFVLRADGSVLGGKGGMFTGGALDAALQPGDMVVVPDKAYGGGFKWKETLQVAQLVSAVGIAVQVARSF
jgi:protein involved in polysaccharide export with SLBB domain